MTIILVLFAHLCGSFPFSVGASRSIRGLFLEIIAPPCWPTYVEHCYADTCGVVSTATMTHVWTTDVTEKRR